MGTSASHKGPKHGVSFDPPWLNDIDDIEKPAAPMPNPQTPLAPPARFRSARSNMGNYVRTGDKEFLAKSLGNYSRTGMGGSRNVANRMRYSANIASKIYSSFSSLRERNEPEISSIINSYRNANADVYSLIDAIAEYICGDGGSLDETSSIGSVSSALSDLFDENPDVDITALSDDDIWSLVSSFLGYEAFSRIQLDIGRGFETNDVPLDDRVMRLRDMREYLDSEISSQINIIRNEIVNKSLVDLQRIMTVAIERTFTVFEVAI